MEAITAKLIELSQLRAYIGQTAANPLVMGFILFPALEQYDQLVDELSKIRRSGQVSVKWFDQTTARTYYMYNW